MEGADAHLGDFPVGQAVAGHEVGDSVNRGMGPATAGIGFVIGLLDRAPRCAEVGPKGGGVLAFAGKRGGAGEACFGKECGDDARGRAPADAVTYHRGMVDAAHHLAARPVVFANARRMADVFGVAVQHARDSGSDAHRRPGARGVIIGAGCVLDQTRAVADLIGGGEVGREFGPGEARSGLGDREQRREDRRARMALGMAVRVVGIDGINGEGPRHCRPGRRHAAPVHQHARGSGRSRAKKRKCTLSRDLRKIGGGPDRRDAHGVDETATQDAQHILGNVLGPQPGGEPRHV